MSKSKKLVAPKRAIPSSKTVPRASAAKTRGDSKQAKLIAILKRPDGATVAQLAKALGWQAHTVRGAMSGALKKKLGLAITSEKGADGMRVYRIA